MDDHYAEYSEGIVPEGAAILKDGHTMFPQDIVRDLNRKSYLEKEIEQLQAQLARCVEQLKCNNNSFKNVVDAGNCTFAHSSFMLLNTRFIEANKLIDSLPQQAHLDAEILRCAGEWAKEWVEIQDTNLPQDHHCIGVGEGGSADVCWGTAGEANLAKAVRAKKEASDE